MSSTTEEQTVTQASTQVPYTADRKQLWAWGLGAVTYHALILTFGQVANLFVLGFGLKPLLVGLIMTVPRLLDGLIDPYIGHLSDNMHTRWGRRKPFLVCGAVLAAVFVMAIWWVDRSWSTWAQMAFLLTCATLFYTCWGMFAMAWNAIGYELTDDYHERSRVQGISGMFFAVVLVLNSWIYWIALRPMFGDGPGLPYQQHGLAWVWEFLVRQVQGDPTVTPNEVTGIRWLAIVLAGAAVVAALICAKVCKERFAHANPQKKGHIPMLPAMKQTLKNWPFVVLLLQRGIGLLGGRVCGGVSIFLVLYYVCGGDKDLSMRVTAIAGTLTAVLTFSMMPLMKYVSKLIGKRTAVILGAVVGLASAILLPLITLPGHPYLQLIPALIFTPLNLVVTFFGEALLPDICDYDELQCGQRREGLYTAVMAFFSKIEMSLGAFGSMAVVAWTGLNKDLLRQSDLTINRMWWAALIPSILFALIGWIIIVKFPLTEAKMAEVRRELDARRAKARENDMADAVS